MRWFIDALAGLVFFEMLRESGCLTWIIAIAVIMFLVKYMGPIILILSPFILLGLFKILNTRENKTTTEPVESPSTTTVTDEQQNNNTQS